MSEKKVWFITGASQGLGRALTEEALAAGYRVVATARKPETLHDLVEKYPRTLEAVKLDVTSTADVKQAVREATEAFGRIDVLVNNAGNGLLGAVEEPADQQIHDQFETNVFGVINVLRGVLPTMRSQRSGHIINVTSGLAFFAFPSYGYYSATKFAVNGLSEALAQEVAHHNINVTIAEPGGIRTNFLKGGLTLPLNRMPEAYPTTTGLLEKFNEAASSEGGGDPHKMARVIIAAVESEEPPLHLPIGQDSYTAIEGKLELYSKQLPVWRDRAIDTEQTSTAATV
jgi:NAD(P)-dependent dehydrogenase (short-subunit alcohol dehydrogenase family)